MKKTIALILLICIVAMAIYSCNDNIETTPNIPTSESSKIASGENISDSSLVSSEVFSSNGNSSEADSNDSSVSSWDESDTESEITSIPDESNNNENSSESSFPNESENISDTSSETSSETTSKPSHICNFVKGKTTAPTCTEKGYTIYTCSCGKAEKRDYVPALGHLAGDWEKVKEATTSSTGLKQIKCTRCGTVLEEETIAKLVSDEDKYNVPATAENAHLVEERVLYYLNQYRIAEGTPEATFLWNGKTYKYAKARAEQLVTNFAHDMDDIRAVATELQFGHYVEPYPISHIDPDTGEVVYTGEMSDPYYSPGCSEAITGPYETTPSWTVDILAKKVVANIYSSKTHWSYVGAETTTHITVGSNVDGVDGYCDWYFCIATSSSDQYD